MPTVPGKLSLFLFVSLIAISCKHPDVISMTDGTGGAGLGDAGHGGVSGVAGAGNHGAGGAGGAGGIAGNGTGGGAAGNTGQPDAGGGDVISSMGGSPPSRGPTPPRPGINFPFPQNRMSANCIYPTGYLNDAVQAAYAQWKADTVTSAGAGGHLRVKRPNEPGLDKDSTVSEGIGYGMLIAVYMGDAESQMLFDELWKYEQLHQNADHGLMHWYISADGTQALGLNGATDADEDMAFALLMASRQWGGKGTLDKTYLEHATDQIGKVWKFEILDSKLAGAGDHFLDWKNINISYFAPSYYRAFKSVNINVPGVNWDAVINTAYDTIQIALNNDPTHQQANGLVPAWCSSNGVPPDGVCSQVPPPGTGPMNYQYDSCRTPFRIGLDWCLAGEPRAKAYVTKTSNFFSQLGGAGKIVDGYKLDGTPQPQFSANGSQSAAFVGPAAVGAMSAATYQTFLDQAYAAVASRQLLVGGTYYDDSWTVLSLLMMTGNFLDYTLY
jgi:hypothetical protein